MSVLPVVHGPFVIFVRVLNSFILDIINIPITITITYVRVQHHDDSWFQYILCVRVSVYLSLCLSGRPYHFLARICMAYHCAQHIRLQATSSAI